MYVSQLAVKQMLRQKSGSIVNLNDPGCQPIAGVGGRFKLCERRLNAVTRALAIEYGRTAFA